MLERHVSVHLALDFRSILECDFSSTSILEDVFFRFRFLNVANRGFTQNKILV